MKVRSRDSTTEIQESERPSVPVQFIPERLFGRKYYLPGTIDNPLFRTNRPSIKFSGEKDDKNLINIVQNIGLFNQLTGDVDWSMRMMDSLWNASLYDFIKNQDNCECTARYVAGLLQDYQPQQVVQAFSWLLKDWKPEMKARFLRLCFTDYEPDAAGTSPLSLLIYKGVIFSHIAKDWEFDKDITMNVALILIKEPAENVAKFLANMCQEWPPEKITELIGCLDCILDWEETYFQEFTVELMQEIYRLFDRHTESVITDDGKTREEHVNKAQALLRHLTMMYEVNLAETNLRLAMADYQLALTEHKLRNLSTSVPPSGVSENTVEASQEDTSTSE